jgi:bacterioferritin
MKIAAVKSSAAIAATPPAAPRYLTGKKALREQARKGVAKGAVTPDYALDRVAVCAHLNEALATELVCFLRYKRHYYTAKGIHGRFVAAEFQEHAGQELAHSDQLAERIMQLGGAPDFNPAVSRSAAMPNTTTALRCRT